MKFTSKPTINIDGLLTQVIIYTKLSSFISLIQRGRGTGPMKPGNQL